MDRVTAVRGEPWQMTAGAMAEAQYDLPADAWFFAADRQPRMPFSVLLEAALQPCGWLAAYVGSALTSPTDISFRNLGGTAVQHRPVTPESGTLTCTRHHEKGRHQRRHDHPGVSTSAWPTGTAFSTKGIPCSASSPKRPWPTRSASAMPNRISRQRRRLSGAAASPIPTAAPFPEKQLRMIDRIELFVPDGGPHGLGYIRGVKDVDPDEWFFKAHFYEDPVTPGSLGLESFLQLLKFAAVERWGWQAGNIFEAAALETTHRWLYRGQIVPTNRLVTVEAWITAVDDDSTDS